MFCAHLKTQHKASRFCQVCGAFWPSTGAKALRELEFHTASYVCPEDVLIRMHESQTLTNFSRDATYLLYRKVLVEWLFEIGETLNTKVLTIHTAVFLMDSSLAIIEIPPIQYQGVALVSLVIASKCEELIDDILEISEVAKFTKIPANRLKQLELEVLDSLDWKIHRATPLHFLQFYNSLGVVYDSDQHNTNESNKIVRYVRKYTEFFADLCLQENRFLIYSPEELALSCIASARKVVNIEPIWSPELIELTKFELDLSCCGEVYEIYTEQFFEGEGQIEL